MFGFKSFEGVGHIFELMAVAREYGIYIEELRRFSWIFLGLLFDKGSRCLNVSLGLMVAILLLWHTCSRGPPVSWVVYFYH